MNEYGFQKGHSHNDLIPGRFVLIKWDDVPEQIGMIVSHDERNASYKGDRDVRVMLFDKNGNVEDVRTITHRQILKYGKTALENQTMEWV